MMETCIDIFSYPGVVSVRGTGRFKNVHKEVFLHLAGMPSHSSTTWFSPPPCFEKSQHFGATAFSLRLRVDRRLAGATGLEPATSTVTGWHSNQLSYAPAIKRNRKILPRSTNARGKTSNAKLFHQKYAKTRCNALKNSMPGANSNPGRCWSRSFI